MTFRPKTVLDGRFRVDHLVAMGSQAIVYRGTDLSSARTVAIKTMQDVEGLSNAEARRQFRKEFDVLAVEGIGLPKAQAWLEEAGRPTMVIDWVEGTRMDHEGTQLPIARAVRLTLSILRIVEGLHARRPPVLARDLKPSNLLVNGDEVWLVDLSASRFLVGNKDTIPLGTDGYAAPEQYLQHSEIRSDLFAVGVILFHLLTGEVSQPDDLPCKLQPRRPDASRTLHNCVMRATQADALGRYPSAADMAKVLRKALREELGSAQAPAAVVPSPPASRRRAPAPPPSPPRRPSPALPPSASSPRASAPPPSRAPVPAPAASPSRASVPPPARSTAPPASGAAGARPRTFSSPRAGSARSMRCPSTACNRPARSRTVARSNPGCALAAERARSMPGCLPCSPPTSACFSPEVKACP